MFEQIILPIIMIIGGFLYMISIYKRRGGFLNEKSGYSNMQAFGGWAAGFIVIIAGIIFLIKGIIKMFFS